MAQYGIIDNSPKSVLTVFAGIADLLGNPFNRVISELNDIINQLSQSRHSLDLNQRVLQRETDPYGKGQLERHIAMLESEVAKWDRLRHEFEERGYSYSYFGWFDMSSPYVQALRGKLPLSPETFEEGAVANLDTYARVFDLLSKARYRYDPTIPKDQQQNYRNPINKEFTRHSFSNEFPQFSYGENAFRYLRGHGKPGLTPGWKKSDLQRAIANSGLAIAIPPHRIGDQKNPGYTIDRGIPLDALGIESERYPGQEHTIYLPGIFSRNAYMPRWYYEALYRKIFNTLQNIDWIQLCREGGVSSDMLKYVAVSDFGLDWEEIQGFPDEVLCERLDAEARYRRMTMQQLAEEAKELAPALIFQPGSRWAQPETAGFAPGTMGFQEPNIPEEWLEVEEACDPKVLAKTPRGMLVFFANKMGISILPGDTKEQICRKLIGHIEILRRQK